MMDQSPEAPNSQDSPEASSEPSIGRNEPCPCGSGKKYKRCCGVAAAPKLSTPKNAMGMPGIDGAGGGMPGMDQFDPQMMMQFSQMLSRLPKGQMQKLQGLMQRAMAGKDVSRDAADLEASLPLEMQQMLRAFQMPGAMPGALGGAMPPPETAPADGGMSEAEARRIVEEAAKKGEISQDQATEVLASPQKGSFWKKLTGK